MKIIKFSLLSILFLGCVQHVSLYTEGVTKELITISVPDTHAPLEITNNPQGSEIILGIKLNRSLDKFEKSLDSIKKVRYALHVIKLIDGIHYYDIPRSCFTLSDSVDATVLYIKHPFIISTKPSHFWKTTSFRRGSITFYYQCTYIDENYKIYEGLVSNKLVVPAVFYSN